VEHQALDECAISGAAVDFRAQLGATLGELWSFVAELVKLGTPVADAVPAGDQLQPLGDALLSQAVERGRVAIIALLARRAGAEM
jgi:hypothetical protein